MLFRSPEQEKSRNIIDEAPDARSESLNTPPASETESGTQPPQPAGLRLRPLTELQPSVPGLPQFTSTSLQEGQDPMQNIPEYDEDDSLVEDQGVQMTPLPGAADMTMARFKIVNATEGGQRLAANNPFDHRPQSLLRAQYQPQQLMSFNHWEIGRAHV